MSGIADYSTTPASNTAINTIGIAGTNSPANFDNALRQLMADLATARTDGALASMPYATKSAGYTLLTTDRGKLIDCTAALEIELLAAATAGAGFYFIAKGNGGAVTLDPNGVEEINGSSTSATVANGSSAIVACSGTAWFTIAVGAGDVTQTGTQTLTNKTLTTPTLTTPLVNSGLELGHASDTTLSRGAAGFMAVEGNRVPSPASQATGDIIYRGATEWERLAKGTAGQVLKMNSGATAPEWAGGIGAPDVVLEDQKAAASHGGTFTSGAWRTRTLNTEVRDSGGLCTLSSNEFTFTVAGWVEWSAPGMEVSSHQTRLYNVTDAVATAAGTSENAFDAQGIATRSCGGAAVVAGKAYRIEHQCSSTQADFGFGGGSGFAANEIFTRVQFWRTA
jgi:hypothetical protein